MGLSIARRAVELHKGELSARNMNPGLMVSMKLPAPERAAAYDRIASPAVQKL